MDFYSYVRGNPTTMVDPLGLFDVIDIGAAYDNYCRGWQIPWTANFDSINWGNTRQKELGKVTALVGHSCAERTVPVNFTDEGQARGADYFIIDHHTVRTRGTIQVHCNCNWTFSGDMSSAQGYDTFQFYPSNRGWFGETVTWLGGKGCPKGKPFAIFLPGSTGLSTGGRIDGKPTCPTCQN